MIKSTAMSQIYRHPTQPTVDVPALDLLTLLFGMEQTNVVNRIERWVLSDE